MKRIKRLKVFLIVLAILSLPFLFYKLQGPKIYWFKFDSKEIGDNYGDVFIIQNPPSSKEDLIGLIEEMNDTLKLKNRVEKKELYSQSFYKETFHLTRFFKPYYAIIIGNYVDGAYDVDGDFMEEKLIDYNYKDEKRANDCGEWCPVYPYYTLYKQGSITYEYYPKGFKNNPNKHWDIR
jgi:hypothetical protein